MSRAAALRACRGSRPRAVALRRRAAAHDAAPRRRRPAAALPEVLRPVPRRARATARATPRRACCPGRATSPPASSRSARRPAARCRPTPTCGTSSGAACRTRRCRAGRSSAGRRRSRSSSTTSRRSPPTSPIRRARPRPIQIPSAPKSTPRLGGARGARSTSGSAAARCHGELGRGDGTSAPTLEDDWGHPIRPADLTKRWTFRGGPTRQDIFRTFTTGLNGTPMPSFAEALSDEQRWQLVDYIASPRPARGAGLRRAARSRWSDEEHRPRARRGALRLRAGRSLSGRRPDHRARPRLPPLGHGVTVRAVYNRREIAFQLRWHDMRARPERRQRAGPAGAARGGAGRAGGRRRRGGRRGLLGEEERRRRARRTSGASGGAGRARRRGR